MTVPVDLCRATYTTDGVVKVNFPTLWKFLSNAHVVARHTPTGGVESLLTEGVHYTLVGAGVDSGGTLTTIGASSPLPAGDLVIDRIVPLTQLVDLRNQGSFSPAVHMAMMDQLAMGLQQLDRRISALEALGSLLVVEDFEAQVVELELETDPDDIEETFPFDVAVVAPVGKVVTGAMVVSCSDPLDDNREAVQLRNWSWVDDVLTVGFISGLTPGTTYQITLLCTSMEP